MHEAHALGIRLFVLMGNRPKVIDTREDAFDKITIFVQICAVGFELLAAGAQRDDRLLALELNESNQRIRVVAHVCDDHIGLGNH